MDLEGYAALVAPAIDRVFVSAMRLAGSRGGAELREKYGPLPFGFLVDFRFVLPLRPVTADGVAALSRYRTKDPYDGIRVLAANGMVSVDDDGSVRLGGLGRTFLMDLHELHAATTAELWAARKPSLARLSELLGRALSAAPQSGGDATRQMLPVFEPADDPAIGPVLLNRLGAIRYHRADAHAAAWMSAGLTGAEIVAMPAGPQRDEIEVHTNRGNAPLWAPLAGDERIELLGALAGLPGDSFP